MRTQFRNPKINSSSQAWYVDPDFQVDGLSGQAILDELKQRLSLKSALLLTCCGSTNDLAREELVAANHSSPRLIWSLAQQSGRGRGANRWWSASGGLMFSYVANLGDLGWPPTTAPVVALIAGLAVCQTIHSLAPQIPAGVKWPNDVWIGSRKVCGILTEVVSSHPHQVIIGIGLNVNNRVSTAPESLKEVSTSLGDETDTTFSLVDVLQSLVDRLDLLLRELRPPHHQLVATWQRYCLLGNQPVRVEMGHETLQGICRSIDDQGALLVQTETGLRRCLSGTVRRL